MPTICYANTIDYTMPLTQRPHHIMNKLADRGWNVLWVNQSENPDRFRTKINDNLTVYHSWEKFYKKFNGTIDVLFCSWSHRWKDIEKLNPKIVCYDSLDLFPQNQSEEKNMVEKSDIIFTTAKNLFDFHKEHTDKPMYMCENGCFNDFRDKEYPIPDDLKEIPKPWILFSGALAIDPVYGWVDFELIKNITKKYPVIIVGGVWGLSDEDARKICSIENLHFLGVKKYEELQSYYAHCDVNLLPFRRCQTADYSFPLKLVEGCNFGKICVSTNIPVACEFNKKFPKAVLLSDNYKSYIENINTALENKNDEEYISQCFNLANEHDWNMKVNVIEEAIFKFSKERGILL
jgi:glycosyltransferase involved in cell wall biosynthesis